MAETYNRLELDVNIKPHNIITAVQKDSDSRYLDVFLFNNGVPIDLTGHEVRIYMRKPEKAGRFSTMVKSRNRKTDAVSSC